MPDPPTKSKGGRPRASEPRTTVCTWIRVSDYQSLLKLAKQQETSISGLVRQMLHLRIPR